VRVGVRRQEKYLKIKALGSENLRMKKPCYSRSEKNYVLK